VAWVIQRYIDDIAQNPDMKQLGESHLCTLRCLQRLPIGKKVAEKLDKTDIADMCKELRKRVKASTVNQYLVFLRGVLSYAPSVWKECEKVSADCIKNAKPHLVKYQLIGKSTPRKRRPTDDEIARLLEFFNKRAKNPRAQIRMPDIIAFALASSRRRGEIVRIQHGDIDWDRKDEHGNPTPMYMVRDLKHPKLKKGNHKWFPLFPELAEIIRMQPRMNPNDPTERVFPFNGQSVGKAYIDAKKALGITDLRFHDNRREAITRWLAILKNPHQVKLISGHETTHILERVYDATDPASLHMTVSKIERAHI
jgi:integrase